MKNRNNEISYVFLLLYPFVVYLSLYIACCYEQGAFYTIKNLFHIKENLSSLTLNGRSLPILAFMSVIYVGIAFLIRESLSLTSSPDGFGSAGWLSPDVFTGKYSSKRFSDNRLFTQHTRMDISPGRHHRNMNTLIIGSPGSGKTRSYAKPNLMQMNSSYVVMDPKGELISSLGEMFISHGYRLKVVDLINMESSFSYNPFAYIKEDNDVIRIITNLMESTTPKGARSQDPFWEKSEVALLEALMFYLVYEAADSEKNFSTVMQILAMANVSESARKSNDMMDRMFDDLKRRDPDHIAVKQYEIFKQAAAKTAKSILVSLAVRLEKFNLDSVRALTSADELELEKLGKEKTVLFCVIPDSDTSFNFIVSMLFTQIFQSLYRTADRECGGRLPVDVHLILDEFPNVSRIFDFDKILSTMRSRGISASIIIQNLTQLKTMFDKEWESIVGNCDELLYLGGNEQSTHEYISKLLGKQTIQIMNNSKTSGRNSTYSTSYQKTGRHLMDPDEVRLMDDGHAILFVHGERAVYDRKYDLTRHPLYNEISNGGAKLYDHRRLRNALIEDPVLFAESEYEIT